MKIEFYSNCFLEAIKAKIRNPKVKLMYTPAFLNKVPCPHIMWLDEDGEHDFSYDVKCPLPWYKWLWHKGSIKDRHRGCYKAYISQRIEYKFYRGV